MKNKIKKIVSILLLSFLGYEFFKNGKDIADELGLSSKEMTIEQPVEDEKSTYTLEIIEEKEEIIDEVKYIPDAKTDLLDDGFVFQDVNYDLYRDYDNVCGYIYIPDTKISYPICQNRSDNNYYLNHNFKNEYYKNGSIFLCSISTPLDAEEIDPISQIYGHTFKDNTMFTELKNYKKQDYAEEHQDLIIDVGDDDWCYHGKLLSSFVISDETPDGVFEGNGIVYPDLSDEELYNYYIEYIKESSIVETDVEAEYGDKLVMLITCSYETDNARLLVVYVLDKEYKRYPEDIKTLRKEQ